MPLYTTNDSLYLELVSELERAEHQFALSWEYGDEDAEDHECIEIWFGMDELSMNIPIPEKSKLDAVKSHILTKYQEILVHSNEEQNPVHKVHIVRLYIEKPR